MRAIKIQRIEIYGFGRLTDSMFDFTDQAFISLYGENEAGKSTLQNFILYMLFGLPPSKLKGFKPKNSNKLGGKLTITDTEIGAYTIERTETTVLCLFPDGKTENEAWLKRQLAGLNRDIYESIYTFSALDLEVIQQMDETQLSDILFSVGLTGSTHIYELEKQLDKKLGELFKKTGKIPKINKQLGKLDDIHQQIQRFKDNEATYRTQVTELQSTEQKIVDNHEQIAQLKQLKSKYEKIEHLLPSIRDFFITEESLTKLSQDITFPEDGMNRFEANKQSLLPLTYQLATLENDLARNEAAIVKQIEQALHPDVKKHALDLLEEKQDVSERILELKQLTKQLGEFEAEISQLLIDIELNESYVDNVSLPFHLLQTWQGISEENRSLTLETDRLSEAELLVKQESERLVSEQTALKEGLHTPEEIETMKEKVYNFEKIASNKQESEAEGKVFSTWQRKREKNSKTILISLISVAIILFVFGIFTEPSIFITLSFALLIIGVGQFYFFKHSQGELEKLRSSQSLSQTEITEQQYIRIKIVVSQQSELQSELRIIENDLVRNHNEQTRIAEQQRLVKERLIQHQLTRNKEMKRYPFLAGLEPVHWIELLSIIRNAKQLIVKKQLLKKTYTEKQQIQNEFVIRMNQLGDMLHIEPIFITFPYIEKLLNAERGNQQLIDQLQNARLITEKESRNVTSKLKIYETEQAKLFEYAGVEDEEAYFQLSQQLEEKTSLLAARDKFLKQMELTFDAATTENIVRRKMDIQSISFEISEVIEKLDGMEAETVELNKKLARLEIEISQLELSDDYSKATYTFQMEKDKLQADSDKWAVLKVMQTALSQAKKSYQEKYLAEVMTYTTQYFTQITNKVYVNVYSPVDDKGFQVETENMDRFNAEELSQGTINQLYVSLRLAISKVMSNKFVVPLIIDDAFVHFDQERMTESVNILKEISNDQQVFLFTCRKSIAEQTNALNMRDTILV